MVTTCYTLKDAKCFLSSQETEIERLEEVSGSLGIEPVGIEAEKVRTTVLEGGCPTDWPVS